MQKIGNKCNPEFGSIPRLASNIQRQDWRCLYFVIDKVQKKLSSWKAKFLFKAGKMVLAKSAAIPIAEYDMQCQALPIKVCGAFIFSY